MILRGIRADELGGIWPQIEGWISEACEEEGGSYQAKDIQAAILGRDMQLWAAMNGETVAAIAVTEIRAFPRRKTCWVLMVLGQDMALWHDFRHTIAEWAKAQGCTGKKAMKALARRGYMRLFGEYGCSHVLLERDL